MILLEFLKVLWFGSVIATRSGRGVAALDGHAAARRGVESRLPTQTVCRQRRPGGPHFQQLQKHLLILGILSHRRRRKTYPRERRTRGTVYCWHPWTSNW